ncbi:MAG TPA: DinB family protein [Terriglobia bacterium]|nr:DinB family protein [Terriglobia bacterium]
MALSNALLPEFDHEMANTRKTLERLPNDKFAWKPHEKSMALGRLASHLAELPGWVVDAIEKDSFHVSPPGGQTHQPFQGRSPAEVLEAFDKNVTAARVAISGASDDHLLKPWTLLASGKTVFTLPRIAVLRGFVMNHSIHHRAQLGVYLRLNNIPVPAIYGPSADELGM